MKRVIYTGLLALTIAFGVTSCDKNPMEDIAMPTVGAVENDAYSKVSFSESGFGIQIPKLKGATVEASKTAGEFSHIYSDTDQTLIISNGAGAQYTGSYTAGVISTLDPASIILANANGYTATSSNPSNASTDVVLGFLPYTSTVGFDLSATANIRLVASLERGFLIVNAQAEAADGNRVTGATANGEALIGPDAEGDFYGYLLAGDHDIIVTYTLDDVATPVTASQDVTIGVAYTVTLALDDNAPAVVGSDVSTSTGMGIESEIGQTEGGRDINEDGDKLDSLERVVTSTQATLDTVPQGDPVLTYGSWSVVLDINIDASSATVTSTEAIADIDVNTDGDKDDYIQKEVTTTTTSTGGVEASDSVDGEWTILLDRSGVDVTEDTDTTDEGDVVSDPADTLSAFSGWSPLTAAVDVATIDQTRTRTVVQNGDLDAVAPVGDLEESRTIDNPDYVAPVDPIDTYTYSDFSGTAPVAVVTSGTAVVTTATAGSEVEFVVQTTTTPQFSTVAAYQLTREATIVQNGDLDDPAPATDALTQDVAEDVTNLDDLVAMVDVDNIAYVAPAAAWEVSDAGVHSNSDYPSYTFTIDEDPLFGSFGYILSTDGVAADAIIGEYNTAAEAITAGQAAIALL